MKGCDVMPNWTHNRIICKKEIAEKLLTPFEDTYVLDFNKLIPMPSELNLTSGRIENYSIAYYYKSISDEEKIKVKKLLEESKLDFYGNFWNKYKDDINKVISGSITTSELNNCYNLEENSIKEKYTNLYDLGKQYVDNIKNYKFSNWYDWRIENWGTKWNVDDEVSVIDNGNNEYEILFDTAWNLPDKIMLEFSKFCKNGELHWEYKNEDEDEYHNLKKENNKIVDYVVGYEKDYTDDYDM